MTYTRSYRFDAVGVTFFFCLGVPLLLPPLKVYSWGLCTYVFVHQNAFLKAITENQTFLSTDSDRYFAVMFIR